MSKNAASRLKAEALTNFLNKHIWIHLYLLHNYEIVFKLRNVSKEWSWVGESIKSFVRGRIQGGRFIASKKGIFREVFWGGIFLRDRFRGRFEAASLKNGGINPLKIPYFKH